MKWVDYREKLGIGFTDSEKLSALINKIKVLFDYLDSEITTRQIIIRDFQLFYSIIGEYIHPHYSYIDIMGVCYSITHSDCLSAIISKYVAFINTASSCFNTKWIGSYLVDQIKAFLDELNISYELVIDDDGIFIFPKGVPEMDDALVSAPLTWLKDYPNAEKAWSKALRAYSEVKPDTASDVADLFRKALERFFQEFFQTGDGKTLENCKAEYGKYLKDNGVPSEVSNNFETLLQAYTNYMNNYAKHKDEAKINVLEYLMYQTGNIIRLVIMLNQEEAQ